MAQGYLQGSPIFSRPIIVFASYSDIGIDPNRCSFNRCSILPLADENIQLLSTGGGRAPHCCSPPNPRDGVLRRADDALGLAGLRQRRLHRPQPRRPPGARRQEQRRRLVGAWVFGGGRRRGRRRTESAPPRREGRHGCIAVWDAPTRAVLAPLAQPR
jgi:hypothetical protein